MLNGDRPESAQLVAKALSLGDLRTGLHPEDKVAAIIRQNLAISLGVVVLLGLAALGSWIPLPIGVLGHEGSTVVVVLNSLRLLIRSSG